MWRKLSGGIAVAGLVALACVSATAASPGLRGGITDSGAAYYHDPADFYPALEELGVHLLRVHLNWGGKLGVATRRPREGTDFEDPAYDWHLYDRVALQAERYGVELVFTIFGTPAWANGGGAPTRAPTNAARLREFAYAAATRYSGTYVRADGKVLPRVRYWTAWNEPNLQIGLIPQWRRVGKRWVIQSAIDYARICNAVVDGVHTSMLRGQKVACGVTLGNIDDLVHELTRLYGPKRIWLTEYGYQTNPPDGVFGVSWATQARYVGEAFAIARANPRIDMLLWFLLQDEGDPTRWQSGFISADGKRKPSFEAFREALAELKR